MKLQVGEWGGLTDRQKGDRTNTSENNMFPIYDIDILNLNVLSIWNTKISYRQMVKIYQCLLLLQVWKKYESTQSLMVKYSVNKTSLF